MRMNQKNVLSVFAILAIVIMAVSCEKEGKDTELLVKMQISNQDWSTENVQGFDVGDGEYIVTANGTLGEKDVSIDFTIILMDDETRELSLKPGGDADANVSINNALYSTTYSGSSGTLTITGLSGNRIEGMFNFTAFNSPFEGEEQDSVVISNGTFKASFL